MPNGGGFWMNGSIQYTKMGMSQAHNVHWHITASLWKLGGRTRILDEAQVQEYHYCIHKLLTNKEHN